jgi:hypothetical protein
VKTINLLAALLAIWGGSSCGTPAGHSRLVAEKDNPKYKVTCLFYGEDLASIGKKGEKAIESIVLRDQRTGKEVRYTDRRR